MRSSIVFLLLALSASSTVAADHANAEMATLVDIKTADGLAAADINGHKQKLQHNAADGSKGTHYGDPAEGCMKDEVS